jgi:transcriptional regulator with XRE-family HTH domain
MSERKSLGNIIRRIRFERDWTLAEMSAKVGIPLSSLARIERDQASLTYDKILELSERLEIGLLDLFSMPSVPESPVVATGRRSVCSEVNTITVASRNYDDNYLCSELLKKVMTPIIVDVKAASIEEFGPLTVHEGEEFVFVISGSIVVYTSFYEPTALTVGGGHYLDSQMGHAYVRAKGCDSATILTVCASKSEGLNRASIQQMIGVAEVATTSAPIANKQGQGKGGTRHRSSHLAVRSRSRPVRR